MRTDFAAVFTPGSRFASDKHTDDVRAMAQQVIGLLRVPPGRLAIGNALVVDYRAPRTTVPLATPTGSFPVELAIVRYNDGSEAVVCARVRFRDVAATRWDLLRDHNIELMADDEDAVDAFFDDATGIFDVAAAAVVNDATRDEWRRACGGDHHEDVVGHVADVGAANVVMFSGFCDIVTSWAGYGDDGGLVEVVFDYDALADRVDGTATIALPLPRGRQRHLFFERHQLHARAPWFANNTLIIEGDVGIDVVADEGEVVFTAEGDRAVYRWPKTAKVLHLSKLVGERAHVRR